MFGGRLWVFQLWIQARYQSSWNYGTGISILISLPEMATIAGSVIEKHSGNDCRQPPDWVQWSGLMEQLGVSQPWGTHFSIAFPVSDQELQFSDVRQTKNWEHTTHHHTIKIYQDISRWIMNHNHSLWWSDLKRATPRWKRRCSTPPSSQGDGVV